ncbi:hypothetical protein [Delftia sp. GW456-R20]|uniref:hypothetical protein n=1 Tax=Delftia sp. GW456-R20 TaxID=1827145 RepID=UPI0012E90F96|nr:hypothetical protein [Delftia sp. GW456-R20]
MKQSELAMETEGIDIQAGVMLVTWRGVLLDCRRVRRASEGMQGHVFTCVLDARVGLEVDRVAWDRLVNHAVMPLGLVVSAVQLEKAREIAARLAQVGGVLGVFTDVKCAVTWARRQSIVFAGGAGSRTQEIGRTLRRTSLLQLDR